MSGYNQFMAERDGFDRAIFQGKKLIRFSRCGVKTAPFDGGEFVVRKDPITVIFVEKPQFSRESATFLAFRQEFEALD